MTQQVRIPLEIALTLALDIEVSAQGEVVSVNVCSDAASAIRGDDKDQAPSTFDPDWRGYDP